MIFGGIMQIFWTTKRISEGATLVRAFSILLSYVSSITSLMTIRLKRNLAPVILKHLYKLDRALLEYEVQVRESKKWHCVYVTKIYVLLFSAILCTALAFVCAGNDIGHFCLSLLSISNFISLMALFQVLGFISYLHHKLAALNMVILTVFKKRRQRLSSYNRKYKHGVLSRIARDVSLSDSREKNNISVINSHYSRILPCGTPLNQHSVPSNILSIRNTYNRIYELLGTLSSIYGFPILVEMAHNFFWILGVSYIFVILLYSHEAHGHNLLTVFASVAHVGFWLVFSFLRLLIITVTCENLRSENKRLSDSVHKLLLQQDMAADSVHQLQLFTFQLQSSKMEFSAAGLFSVDLPYLYSSIAAIVTYFVVLLQIK
jgi:hypothetical protein